MKLKQKLSRKNVYFFFAQKTFSLGQLLLVTFILGIISIGCFLVDLTFFEPYENDSLPKNLSTNVSFIPIRASEFDSQIYQLGDDCKTNLEIIQYTGYERTDLCNVVSTALGKVYWIRSSALTEGDSLVLERTSGNFELIYKQNGAYPGNHISSLKSNDQYATFTYEGWNNPKKFIKIQFN